MLMSDVRGEAESFFLQEVENGAYSACGILRSSFRRNDMVGKKRLFATLMIGSILTCGALLAAEDTKPGEVRWLTDAKAAVALAKKEHKVILADFTGSDWCHWCKKLDADVYSTPEFKTFAKEKLVLLTVDFPQAKPQSDAEKKQKPGIRGQV